MRTYVFIEATDPTAKATLRTMAWKVIEKVAQTTDTRQLVVAVYLLEGSDVWRGQLVSRKVVSPESFLKSPGRCSFVRTFPTPDDLPPSFALIRMAFGLGWRNRRIVKERYGYQLRFGGFEDQLAFLFAHELHHFRRYFLELHPMEGDLSANKWALERITELGYDVEVLCRSRRGRRRKATATRVPSTQNPKLLQRVKQAASHLCPSDLVAVIHWARERA